MNELVAAAAVHRQQGCRRLLTLSGAPAWCRQQATSLMAQLPGDWLWVGSDASAPLHCQPQALRTLLGREFHHAVFDAREGFHAEAFAALAGTLRAGSWLLLLLPEWDRWAECPDTDSLRWSDSDRPCASPRFVQRFQQLLLTDAGVVNWRQSHPLMISPVPQPPDWQTDSQQQQRVLERLINAPPGIYALTAARGRGKSALAGMLAARWPGRCLVTAPARAASDVLAGFAGERYHFVAPDRLLASAQELVSGVDWLLVDEAAAIPAPLLQQLVALFPRVLLTTTVQGYEGTGRGFMLKFCDGLPDVTHYRLDAPLRWAAGDPLERIVAEALLLDDAVAPPQSGPLACLPLEQADWIRQPARMAAVYQLLTSAHYRTSPLDLRRMMDAPGMHFIAALQEDSVQGALWLVDEGGLSAGLSAAIWAGTRRPRGSLVAQSLAAHAGDIDAPQLRSRRISRIAVAAPLRGQGCGQQLVACCQELTPGLDFLSVSFGFTDPLWRFWQRCGFQLVRFGTHREASSGCYTAMAILPLSPAGERLAGSATRRLARNAGWLHRQSGSQALPLAADDDLTLIDDDWLELSGFAWAQRPFEVSYAALGRLIGTVSSALPLLRAAISEGLSPGEICTRFRLSGRKALLAAWRQEAQQGLMARDPLRAQQHQQWVISLQ